MSEPMSTDWGEPRSRTVTWWDPMIGARAGMGMAGIDYLRAIRDGRLRGSPQLALIGA